MWDEVLEYRVWYRFEGDSIYKAFATWFDAHRFAYTTPGTEQIIALVRQVQYFEGDNLNDLKLVDEERITEWLAEWLTDDSYRLTFIKRMEENK